MTTNLENVQEFKKDEKILWYSTESETFFGYSIIKNAKFHEADGELISEGYSAFDLKNSYKFENPLKRTREIYELFSETNLYYNNYRILSEEIFQKIISIAKSPETLKEEYAETSHNSVVLDLLKIGKILGCEVWVANDLKSQTVNETRLGNLSIDTLEIPGFDETTMKIIRAIDVLWLKKSFIFAGFEVEHTTQIYSGLLRFTDLFLSIPNLEVRAFIVAPDERQNQVKNQFNRITFKNVFENVNSKVKTMYYSSLNLGNEIIQEVYKRGGPHSVDNFLHHCENADWDNFSEIRT